LIDRNLSTPNHYFLCGLANVSAFFSINVQKKGSVAAEEQAAKAIARAVELEKQVWMMEVEEQLKLSIISLWFLIFVVLDRHSQ
jgi:hypothetical protein